MAQQIILDGREEFVGRLRRLVEEGVPRERIRARLPFYVHEVEEILGRKPGYVRFFTLIGALTGFLAGFGLTVYTVLHWPLITGGKPIVSIPPFLLIAYILTILFGSLATFAGFIILSILPRFRRIYTPLEEDGNRFVLLVDEEEPS
jgi:hypothetical protein